MSKKPPPDKSADDDKRNMSVISALNFSLRNRRGADDSESTSGLTPTSTTRTQHAASSIEIDPPTPESGSVAQMFVAPRPEMSKTGSLGVPTALKTRGSKTPPTPSPDARRNAELEQQKKKQIFARKKPSVKEPKPSDSKKKSTDTEYTDTMSISKSTATGYSVDSKGERTKRKRRGSNSIFLHTAIGVTATEVRKRIHDLTRPDETSTSSRYAVNSLLLLVLLTGLVAWDTYCIYVSEKMLQTTQDYVVFIMLLHAIGFFLAVLSYAYCVQTSGYLFSENGVFSMAIALNHLFVFCMRMFYEIMHLQFRQEHYAGFVYIT